MLAVYTNKYRCPARPVNPQKDYFIEERRSVYEMNRFIVACLVDITIVKMYLRVR